MNLTKFTIKNYFSPFFREFKSINLTYNQTSAWNALSIRAKFIFAKRQCDNVRAIYLSFRCKYSVAFFLLYCQTKFLTIFSSHKRVHTVQ